MKISDFSTAHSSEEKVRVDIDPQFVVCRPVKGLSCCTWIRSRALLREARGD